MSAPPAKDVAKIDSAAATAEAPLNALFFTAEGDLTDKFYSTLRAVFLKFAKLPADPTDGEAAPEAEEDDEAKAKRAAMGREEMNAFSKATNGEEIPDEQWDEVVMYLDVNDDKKLTFKGFVGLYTLQTENDEPETLKDLGKWGYDPKTLELVRNDNEEEAAADKA